MVQQHSKVRDASAKQRISTGPVRTQSEPHAIGNAPEHLVQRASLHPNTLTPADAARLQRTIGNHALGCILTSAAHTSPRSAPPIQAKMQVGPADDKYEQEADQVANRVMRSISAPAAPPNNDRIGIAQRAPMVQRHGSDEQEMAPQVGAQGGPVAGSFESSLRRARSGGQPLDAGLRTRMERGMGAAFDGVRVHTDAQADSLNRAVNARAFTSGPDIFFRRGEYNPESPNGQRLVAHELTHVVQQGAASQTAQRAPDEIQRKGKKGANDIGVLEQGLTPNFPPTSNDAPDAYQVTVGVARILPEFLKFAKERMKSTLRNKARSKARGVPLLKGLVRKAKTKDEIKSRAASKAVSARKTAQGQQDTTPTQQEIQHVINNSDSTGHSWVKFSALNAGGQAIKTYSFGYYSSQAPDRPTDTVPGQVINPDTEFEGATETRFLHTRVNAAKYARGLDKALKLKANPPAYNTIDYNCTKFVKEVTKEAGAAFPSGATLMIPFSNAGQVRLFHKVFVPNALFDKIDESGSGTDVSPEKQGLTSGAFKQDPITGALVALSQEQQQQQQQARVTDIIRGNANRIGNWELAEWLQVGVNSDQLEDLSDEVIMEMVEDEIDIAGLFATFQLPIPQVALIAVGKIGKVIKAFSADSLYSNRRLNAPANSQVRISKIKDGEVQFEVAKVGQAKMELSEFVKLVDFSG